MPIGDRAIVEVIVDRLVESDVTDITLCVGYLAHLIEAIFNGRPRGAQLTYVHEDIPLGTAGPLRLVDGLDGTFIVMNGDLLTDLGFGALIDLHRMSGNTVTIATHERRNVVDYGVLHTEPGDSPRLVAYDEKPETRSPSAWVSMSWNPRCSIAFPRVATSTFLSSSSSSSTGEYRSERSPSQASGSTSAGATTTSRR